MEERCYRCGSPENLQEAIAEKEIVMVCKRCQSRENLPLIKKVKMESFENEPIQTVQERLARISGVAANPRADREKMLAERKRREEELEARLKQDDELRKMANKNFQQKLKDSNTETDTSGNSSMVRNFHWVIMRARRARHLTQRDFARAINEPEAAVIMAEKGVLPREREELVKKIQKALNIQITKIPYATYTKLPEKAAEEQYVEQETSEEVKEKKKGFFRNLFGRKEKYEDENLSQEEIDKALEENSM